MKISGLDREKLRELFSIIQTCKGDVYMISPDMHINLKSNLAQFVSFTSLYLADKDDIEKIEIIAQQKEDIDMLSKFIDEDGD